MNKNYNNGRAKEYRIVNKLKDEGYDIAFRSAGSHSKIDVIAINKETRTILCIQSKPKKFSKTKKLQLEKELFWLNDLFQVRFELK